MPGNDDWNERIALEALRATGHHPDLGDPEADAVRSRRLRDALTQVPKHIQEQYDRLNAEQEAAWKAKHVAPLEREIAELRGLLNTPELHDFSRAVVLEAAHQRARWGSEHDAGKAPADWFWLLGYLSGKALAAAIRGDTEKALHHCVSSAAALANWHASLSGSHTGMRPGIEAGQ